MKSTLCRTYFKCIRRDLDSTFALGLRLGYFFSVSTTKSETLKRITYVLIGVDNANFALLQVLSTKVISAQTKIEKLS